MQKLSIKKDLFKLIGKTIKDIRETWEGSDYVILFTDDTYCHIEPKEPFRQWGYGDNYEYPIEEQRDMGIITEEEYIELKRQKDEFEYNKKYEEDMKTLERIKKEYQL